MRRILHAILVLACLFSVQHIITAQLAPDFTVTDSHGNEHTLYSDYLNQGKTVMLKIFFTTCPPCNAIAPWMEPLYQEWGAGEYDVEFFELSDKSFDTDALVNNYQANHGQTFPGAGADGGSLDAVAPYKQGMFGPFFGTPTFVVIAPDGTVTYDIRGSNNAETIEFLDTTIAATGAMKPPCFYTENIDVEICPGECFGLNGEDYCFPGVYIDTIIGDCDTFLFITVTETPLVTVTIDTSICEGDSLELIGNIYFQDTIDTDTLQGAGGDCDTIVTISVTVDPLNELLVEAEYEEGDSVFLYGQWYSEEGTYILLSESTTGGCDTNVTLVITEIPANPILATPNGMVQTFASNFGISGAVVIVTLNGSEVARDTTGSDGSFSFTMDSLYIADNDLEVHVEKSLSPDNGVTVLDLLALQKHLLGLQLLNSVDKLFAADLNRSGNLTVLDVLYYRQFLLGYQTDFPQGASWLFFPSGVTFGAPGIDPPIVQVEPVLLRNVLAGTQSGTFRGIKIGDLNGSANPQE